MKNSLVCVDANVIIRTIISGPFSKEATDLLAQWHREECELIAPAICSFEVTSTLHQMVYLKAITQEDGEKAFENFLRIKIHLSHRQSIFPLAWRLAKQFNLPRAYDTAYLALAQLNNCEFWTADEKLYNGVRHSLGWVKWIGQDRLIKRNI